MALHSYLSLKAGGKDAPILFEEDATRNELSGTDPAPFSHETGDDRIRQGRIISTRIVQPNVLDSATAKLPDQVELCVLPNVSEVESMTGGTISVDDWASRGA